MSAACWVPAHINTAAMHICYLHADVTPFPGSELKISKSHTCLRQRTGTARHRTQMPTACLAPVVIQARSKQCRPAQMNSCRCDLKSNATSRAAHATWYGAAHVGMSSYLRGTVSAGLWAAAGRGLLLLPGALVLDQVDAAAAALNPILPPATKQDAKLYTKLYMLGLATTRLLLHDPQWSGIRART